MGGRPHIGRPVKMQRVHCATAPAYATPLVYSARFPPAVLGLPRAVPRIVHDMQPFRSVRGRPRTAHLHPAPPGEPAPLLHTLTVHRRAAAVPGRSRPASAGAASTASAADQYTALPPSLRKAQARFAKVMQFSQRFDKKVDQTLARLREEESKGILAARQELRRSLVSVAATILPSRLRALPYAHGEAKCAVLWSSQPK